MSLRCALAASPAAVLSLGPRGGTASAALLSKHRSRAAACGAARPLLSGVAARQPARGARLHSAPQSHKQQRGPTPPYFFASCLLADAARRLLQHGRATATMQVTNDEEDDDDDRVTLVAEQEPSVTASAPRGALASYCRLLRSQAQDWRDSAVVVPHVDGKQLLALAAWLNREPLRYDTLSAACAASQALDVPLLLHDIDLWLEAQEREESTQRGGGALVAFNDVFRGDEADFFASVWEARFIRRGARNFDWAMWLAMSYRLPRFRAALLASLERLPSDNARELLLHVARRALLEDAA